MIRKFSWTRGYLQNFITIQQVSQKLWFALFQNIFYDMNQFAADLLTFTEEILNEKLHLSWFNPFSKGFIPKGPSKVKGFSICNYFWQILIATSSEPRAIRTVFWRLFEDTRITTRFTKRHICNAIENNTLLASLFSTIRDKRNFKVRPNHAILKGMDTS